MEEHIFLNENDIKVTSTRLVVEDHTFAMSGVTSIELVKEEKTKPILSILTGVGLLFYGIYQEGNVFLVFGAILLVFSLAMWFKEKEVFTIILHTSSGEQEALTDEDSGFVERVQKALNDAIIFRG